MKRFFFFKENTVICRDKTFSFHYFANFAFLKSDFIIVRRKLRFECSAQLPDGHQIHSVLSRCSDGHQNHSVLCREMQRTVFCPFDFAGSESILLDFLVFRRSHCHSVTDYYSWNFYFFSGAAVTVSLIIAPTFFNISQKRLSQCH